MMRKMMMRLQRMLGAKMSSELGWANICRF
jgi:hypothetical protein